jgi:DNA-binding NarL/FixJ family response regulator
MNILIVDDHPMTVAGYIESISKKEFFESLLFSKAFSCEEAFSLIEKRMQADPFGLAIIDYGLPAHKEQGILNGCDLAEYIRKRMPLCKILIITAHNEIIVVYDILKYTKPDGLIIKNDLTPENLPSAIIEIIGGNTFQSPTVKSIVQEIWKKELMIDDVNRQILLYLSKGYKIKDIQEIVPLSLSPIQRRIAQMKDAFGVSENNSLVKEAILQGYI